MADGDDYQVRITDGDDSSIFDISDGFFTITDGVGEAAFTYWPGDPKEQQSIRFADTSTGSCTKYQPSHWIIGAGFSSKI